MKKHFSICIVFFFLMCGSSLAQVYRLGYAFHYKKDKNVPGYFKEMEMRVDFDGKTLAYYSEPAFLKDSLRALAFDRNGQVANQAALREMGRVRGGVFYDTVLVDLENRTMDLFYQVAVISVRGSSVLTVPLWTMTGESRKDPVSGLPCLKAEADYLGRHWTAWFTTDIPVPAGPWCLWGLPGVIVYAEDGENLFHFQLMWTEEANASRYDFLRVRKRERPGTSMQQVSLGLTEAERFHNRLMRDPGYLDQLTGASGGYVTDRSGRTMPLEQTLPYIPLIPDGYFNDK